MSRPKGIPKTGGRKKGSVNVAIRAVRERMLREEALTVESTVEAIRRGCLFDPRALFDADGNIRNIKDLSEAEAWAIAGFEVIVKNAKAGDGHVDTVHKIKLVDRGRYVELAAKHLGLLVEKVEVSGGNELIAALLAGRERARGLPSVVDIRLSPSPLTLTGETVKKQA